MWTGVECTQVHLLLSEARTFVGPFLDQEPIKSGDTLVLSLFVLSKVSISEIRPTQTAAAADTQTGP